jgi:hypothetical protein
MSANKNSKSTPKNTLFKYFGKSPASAQSSSPGVPKSTPKAEASSTPKITGKKLDFREYLLTDFGLPETH